MPKVPDLLRLPAAAVHSLGADVLHIEAVDHFRTVFADACVHHALFTAFSFQVMANEETSDSRDNRNWHSDHQMLWRRERDKEISPQ